MKNKLVQEQFNLEAEAFEIPENQRGLMALTHLSAAILDLKDLAENLVGYVQHQDIQNPLEQLPSTINDVVYALDQVEALLKASPRYNHHAGSHFE